jgi:uncharacterized protein with PQ loop repeat
MEYFLDFKPTIKWFFDLILIFGPNIAFVLQIIQFRSSKSNEGFSKKITLFFLLANIFRIFFWYGKRFEYTLLLQSIISILMQLFLLNECLNLSSKNQNIIGEIKSINVDNKDYIDEIDLYCYENQVNDEVIKFKQSFNNHGNSFNFQTINENENNYSSTNLFNLKELKKNILDIFTSRNNMFEKISKKEGFIDIFNPKMFWNWPLMIDYILFLVFLVIFLIISNIVFGYENDIYIESLGYISIFFESLSGIPQIFQNFQNKSTKNLSFYMIALWLTGDSLKTLYFLHLRFPLQFLICGLIQMILDSVIIFQINFYK